MSLHVKLIKANFSAIYLDRARAYVRAGNVLEFEHDRVKKQVRGKIQGTKLYTAQIDYGEYNVAGFCSCPIRYNCKHVAALLLSALEAQEKKSVEPASFPGILKSWASAVTPASQLGHKRIIYIIEQCEEGQVPTLIVAEANLLKNGEIGLAKPISRLQLARSKAENLAQHLVIYDLLEEGRISYRRQAQYFQVEGYTGGYALEHILAENAGYLGAAQGPRVKLGPNCDIDFGWVLDTEGKYRLKAMVPGYRFFKTDPVWYLHLETAQIGVVRSAWSPRVLNQFLAAQPTSLKQLNLVSKRFGESEYFPLPPVFKRKTKRTIQPFPILRFLYKRVYKTEEHFDQYLVGVPLMKYGAVEVHEFWKKMDAVSVLEDEVLVQYPRDLTTERIAFNSLVTQAKAVTHLISGRPVLHGFVPYDLIFGASDLEEQKMAWHEWMLHNRPVLEQQGWVIEGHDLLDEEVVLTEIGEDYFNLDEDRDWFSAELGVVIQGENVNLLPVLIQVLKKQKDILKVLDSRIAQEDLKPFYVRLENNKIVGLPIERAKLFFTFLQDLYNKPLNEEGKLELSKNELAYIALLDDANNNAKIRWMGQTQFLAVAKKLSQVASIPQLPAPQALQATLRQYQQEGFNWMHFLHTQGLSGILADDMGLGKTVQTLAYILQQKESGQLTAPVLIVAPTSLMVNWAQEIEKFASGLSFVISHGKHRNQTFNKIEQVDVVLTTYPLLYRDRAVLEPKVFHSIILDEAQVIKNAKAQTTLIVQNLQAKQRFCLSGTPLENHLGELWSLFHFLMPGFLGNAAEFKRNYRTPIEKHGDQGVKALLLRRIKPFILRRTKSQVVLELPPKTEIILRSVMDKKQQDLYETIRVSLHAKVQKEIVQQGFARSQIVILDALLKLRQICCDPRLLKAESAHTVGSAKLEQLMQILGEMLEEGRKILLFSQFTSMLTLIEQACTQAGIAYVLLTGQTQDRKTPVERFQRGEVPLFLISLKAGGTGLNLTQADTVIHYDPWWNPAVERQATDRAHRIGQDKPVFVYKLITEGTVEEKIVALQSRKGALAEAILEGNTTKNTLFTEADVQALFTDLQMS